MSDPIEKINRSHFPIEQPPTQVQKEEFSAEDTSGLDPFQKELITKYKFSRKEAEIFNKNFIQLSLQVMKKDLDRETQSIKKMFKEDQE